MNIVLQFALIGFLFLFVLIGGIVIIWITYKVFKAKESITFPTKKKYE